MTPASPATASLSRWIFPKTDAAAAAALARDAGLPLIIAELLIERGVHTPIQAEQFLHPRIEHLLDPYGMRGMREAVTRIQVAIDHGETILIYGDYDVDGTMAIVLLKTAIEILGGHARFHIPHRIRDGYGMQAEVIATAAQEGVRVVVSVDNGIRAFAAAEAAKRFSLDLIITDHHLPESAPEGSSQGTQTLPPALAILNPNQEGCSYGCKDLCGAGVAFKLSQALLEAKDYARARNKILPSFLKMLAIATVADAVPLRGENRVLLSIGLEQLRNPVNPGLRALMRFARLDPTQRQLTAAEISFRIAPRINAAGRMDVASDVVELFTTRDPLRAQELAGKLDLLNEERRQTEASVLKQIEDRLGKEEFAQKRCIVIDGEGWHRGIIGILASRVVDRVGRPSIVLTVEDGEAYGSGRSIPGFHLLEAIQSCHELFTRFGGHAHAVGFSLPAERIPELRRRLESWGAGQSGLLEALPLNCHAPLPLDEITPALFSWLRRLEPMGMGNEEPVFAAYNVRIAAPPRTLKDRHMRLRLAQGPRASLPALGWNWAGRAQDLGLKEGSIVDVAYKLKENDHPEFGGLELEIVDLILREVPDA